MGARASLYLSLAAARPPVVTGHVAFTPVASMPFLRRLSFSRHLPTSRLRNASSDGCAPSKVPYPGYGPSAHSCPDPPSLAFFSLAGRHERAHHSPRGMLPPLRVNPRSYFGGWGAPLHEPCREPHSPSPRCCALTVLAVLRLAGDQAVGKSALAQSFHSEGTEFPTEYSMVRKVMAASGCCRQ